MKSKISCCRLVKSMPSPPFPDQPPGRRRTCVRESTAAHGRTQSNTPATAGNPGQDPTETQARGYTGRPRACGGIGRRARLRALWTVWSVEVRVLSGAPQKAPEITRFRGSSGGDLERNAKPVWQDFGKSRQAGSAARARRTAWLDANIPACTRTPRPAAARCTDSNGRQRQKRGFTSPSAAAKFRARMQVRAERGELRITRETFAEHFDGWLKGHHRASKAPRDGYRAAGERRLKPYFGPMRLSAIDVQVVRNFAAEMVELVEAGELAPKTVKKTLSCLSTCLKDAVALHKIASNPCEHIAHLPESHIERDWLRRGEIPLYQVACSELY